MGWEYPGGQYVPDGQTLQTELPGVAKVPRLHVAHTDSEEAAVWDEYVPPVHCRQLPEV